MRYFAHYSGCFKTLVFIAWALLCSIRSNAQSDPNHSFLNITTVADEDESKEAIEANAIPPDTVIHFVAPRRLNSFLFADFGTSDLISTVKSNTQYAHGATFALSWQAAHKFRSANDFRNLYLSAGLEVRNFNVAYTYIDDNVGQARDKLHFWYAGIPLLLQYVNTKHHPGNANDVNYYLQAGATVIYRLTMNYARNDGNDAPQDHTSNYTSLLGQAFVGAGISYTTPDKTYLLGPFMAYGINNISSVSNATIYLNTYGIRFSALLFR